MSPRFVNKFAKMALPIIGGCCVFANAAAAQAQANGRALEQASDAFGVRIGVEQIGLYSESQVRGLSLQDAGNYRLGGAYFIRAGALIDPILGGVVTRVGFNALEFDFPSPSGVVEYRLRSPFEFRGMSVELTAQEYGGRFLEAVTSLTVEPDRLGLLMGAAFSHFVHSSDYIGKHYRFGSVGEWRPNENTRLMAFGSINDFDFEGSYAVAAIDSELPPPLPHPNRYVPRWGDHDGQDINGGIIATVQPQGDLTVRAAAIYSRLELDDSEFVNISLDRNGRGRATIISNRPRNVDALAASLGASWSHAPGRRVFGEVRFRSSRNAFTPGVAVQIPSFDQRIGLTDSDPPILADLDQTVDRAEQVTAGIGYELSLSSLRLKGGVQWADYRRTFSPPDAEATASSKSPLLYDLSAVAALGSRSTLFATFTRGLEDAGVAPNNAINRNEVMPAIVATQYEIGLRQRLGDSLTLVTSAFSIEKPAAVFDTAGVYSLSGDLRHRGLEASLAGQLTQGLRLLAGVTYLDAERAGERVSLGEISKEIPGISRYQGLAGLVWSVPGIEGLSLDGQITHWSSRRVRSDRDLRAPDYTTVGVGALYNFNVGETAMTLRLRINNLFDTDAWVALRSETLDRVGRRGVRLSLRIRRNG